MSDRDCANCANHTENGCTSWECEFKPKVSDLINRQAAIDACLNGKCANVYDCADAIKALPSAERKGKWIPVTNGRGGHECDQCHNYAPAWQTGEERLSDFCPHCGASMVRGEEE